MLFALAFAVRVVGLGFGLPHALARPDEETIVGNALRLEHVEGWNPKFFSYPSLLIYASFGLFKFMLVLMRLAGETDATTLNGLFNQNPACFHWTLRLLSLVCGSLTPTAVYLAARRLYGAKTALLAGLILALSYLHVRDSHFGATDVPFVFLACLSFWQLAKFFCSGRVRTLAGASVLAGLSIGTKYTGAWLCMPFAVAIGFAVWRKPPTQRIGALLRMSAVALAVTFATFFASSPFVVLDYELARAHFGHEMRLVGEESPIIEGINGYLDHLRISLWYGLGWPVFLGALASGLAMALRRSARGLLLWSLPVAFYLYTGSSNRVFIRYMDIVLPFLAIACAWGVHALCIWYQHRRRRQEAGRPRGGVLCLSVACVLILLLPSLRRIYLFDQRMTQLDTRLELRRWLIENVSERDPILWSGGWSAMPHMLHHVPIRTLHATEKLQQQFVDQPATLYNYRWIVLVEWPRVYYRMGYNEDERAFLHSFMQGRYDLVHQIDADKADLPPELFSPLDHFYMSFPSPGIIDRPGPGYRIYRRID